MKYPHYHPYSDGSGRWRWYYAASKTEITAVCGKCYCSREECIAAIELLRGSGSAPIL